MSKNDWGLPPVRNHKCNGCARCTDCPRCGEVKIDCICQGKPW